MAKIQAASPEEHAFAAEVNKRLAAPRPHFCLLASRCRDADPNLRPCLHLWPQAPYHHFRYELPLRFADDVVDRVKRWLASSGTNNLYSPDLKYAE